MSTITTHVLDTSLGVPAPGIEVELHAWGAGEWSTIARAKTDADGRVREFASAQHAIRGGTYRMVFLTAPYFAERGVESFYPSVQITFEITDEGRHYHVPLLLAPFGYSTYRGS